MKVLLLAFAVLAATEARRFCAVDDDCTDLGDLTCQYSRCGTWGICGCARGYAVRFMGTEMKFQCQMLKKIGETCSEDGAQGVCGPDDSFCDGGRCTCNSGMIAGWDGEKCFSDYELSDHFGETCSASLGQCSEAGVTCTSAGNTFEHAGLWYEMPICACPQTKRLIIPNLFDVSPFVGRRSPMCTPILIGDQCMYDSDCSPAQSECVSSVCACVTDYEAVGTGATCVESATVTVLSQGATCWDKDTLTSQGTCGLNMECGDPCSPDEYNDASNFDKSCTCITGYSGSSCTAVAEGDACDGDMDCKGIAYDALCLDSVCVAGASGITFSLLTILFMVVAHYL